LKIILLLKTLHLGLRQLQAVMTRAVKIKLTTLDMAMNLLAMNDSLLLEPSKRVEYKEQSFH